MTSPNYKINVCVIFSVMNVWYIKYFKIVWTKIKLLYHFCNTEIFDILLTVSFKIYLFNSLICAFAITVIEGETGGF